MVRDPSDRLALPHWHNTGVFIGKYFRPVSSLSVFTPVASGRLLQHVDGRRLGGERLDCVAQLHLSTPGKKTALEYRLWELS